MIDLDKVSVSDLVTALVHVSDREIDDFNQMYDALTTTRLSVSTLAEKNKKLEDALEKERTEKEELLEAYRTMEKGVDTVMANANKHLQYAEQARREKAQMEAKLTKLEMALAPYKVLGTAKKIREQVKGYKEKAATNLKTITSLKGNIKTYRGDIVKLADEIAHLKTLVAQSSIQSIWSNKGDSLLLFPSPLTMDINGQAEKQITLLFMNNSGCGRLVGLGEGGEPMFCSMPKGGLKPKVATVNKAGEILRKFKSQDWIISHKDIEDIKGENYAKTD